MPATVALDASDSAPSPIALVACTAHVYAVPSVSAPTTIGDSVPEADSVEDPLSLHVAVYPVTLSASIPGGEKLTESALSAATTPVTDGVPGIRRPTFES